MSETRKKLFGTDGVRGVANADPMTSEVALRLGRAVAHVFRESPRRHKILIGKDTRVSGYMLETAMASGICSMGVDVLLVGPMPTPGIAFLTRSLRADAGVVISASHNPFQDNGIKFFARDGFKLPDAVEEEIEDLVFAGSIDHLRPTAGAVGKAFRIDDALGRYNVFAKNTFPRDRTLDGLKIVVDAAHGAGYKAPPETDPGVVANDSSYYNVGDVNCPGPACRIYCFRHVEDLRQIMVNNGDSGKRVVVLEFGWTRDERPDSPYYWHRVQDQFQ